MISEHRYSLAGGLLLACLLQSVCTGASYTIVDLGTLSGGTISRAAGINNHGEVVGSADTPGGQRGFLYSGGVMQPLDTLGGANAGATAINDSGQITGTSWLPNNQNRAYLYSGGALQDIGTLASGPGNHRSPASSGYAINDLGQVVGQSHVNDVTFHAFLYDGAIHDLTPNGGPISVATDINNSATIVGYMSNGGAINAFYHDTALHLLPTLGGGASYAEGINDGGQIVGYAYHADNVTYRAVIFAGNSLPQDLGTLGGASSQALDINKHGQVVGGAHIQPGSDVYHGFLYSNGVMYDLTDLIDPNLGWEILKATAINDQGQIVGWGTINGATRAYLMTPVPEPSSLVLAAFGLIGLAALVVRRLRVNH